MRTPKPEIAEFERRLQQRDDQIKALRTELTEAQVLVDKLREWTEDSHQMTESWKDAFEMRQTGDGRLEWNTAQTELLDRHLTLIADYNKLVRGYNRLVRERWPRLIGRPLAASEMQAEEVRQRLKRGESLRATATATGLSLGTVRTIQRGAKRTTNQRRKEFDRLRQARYRALKKTRDHLPAQITAIQKEGEALIKAAKGLGR